jgi:hypothetical protein
MLFSIARFISHSGLSLDWRSDAIFAWMSFGMGVLVGLYGGWSIRGWFREQKHAAHEAEPASQPTEGKP